MISNVAEVPQRPRTGWSLVLDSAAREDMRRIEDVCTEIKKRDKITSKPNFPTLFGPESPARFMLAPVQELVKNFELAPVIAAYLLAAPGASLLLKYYQQVSQISFDPVQAAAKSQVAMKYDLLTFTTPHGLGVQFQQQPRGRKLLNIAREMNVEASLQTYGDASTHRVISSNLINYHHQALIELHSDVHTLIPYRDSKGALGFYQVTLPGKIEAGKSFDLGTLTLTKASQPVVAIGAGLLRLEGGYPKDFHNVGTKAEDPWDLLQGEFSGMLKTTLDGVTRTFPVS